MEGSFSRRANLPAVREMIDILYVGTLPPHAGGSALQGSQILEKLSGFGHPIRAVAPVTTATRGVAEAFAARVPKIEVTRYLVPYLSSSRDELVDEEYRKLEGLRIRDVLIPLLDQRPPALIIAGRESFAWHVPEIAAERLAPCVLLVHGGRTLSSLVTASRSRGVDELLERFRMANLIIPVAEHLGRELKRLGLERLEVIPNPVDLRRFSPGSKCKSLMDRLDLETRETIVVHISKLSSVKRPLDLVEAASRALRRVATLRFVIVGDGPCRPTMIEACRRAGISDRFRFVGWVDHQEVARYLRLADMIVLPSESEGQALVYLESQACGRLVVASDVPGAREVIEDGRTGLLFRMGDTADLAHQIILGATKPGLRARIGAAAQRRVARHHIDAIAARYSRTLEKVAGG